MLLRLLVIFVIFYVLFAVLKAILFRVKDSPMNRPGAKNDGEEMVLDPQCRSYIPKSAAVAQSGKFFCSPECARRYLAR